jgi:hypothetical protein
VEFLLVALGWTVLWFISGLLLGVMLADDSEKPRKPAKPKPRHRQQ